MAKFFVRITIILTSIYLLLSFYIAQIYGVDILNNFHVLPFELCVVIYTFSEGKYHCRYLRFLALGIFLSELISRLDNSYNFLSVSEHNSLCFCLLSSSIGMALYEAIEHFNHVRKVKRNREKLWGKK